MNIKKITLVCLMGLIAVTFSACTKKDAAQPTVDTPPAATTTTAVKTAPATQNGTPPAAPKTIDAPKNVKAPPANAIKTASGLASVVLQKGTGTVHPTATDIVKVNYTGWTTDGKMFDSSVTRGQPAEFPLNRVIPGWTEGVQLMTVGEKRRFWIPAKLAYGETPRRPGAPSGMLVFDIQLISIKAGPKPIAAPADVAKPPKNSKKTATGLRYQIIKKGTGKVHPKATDTVVVNYTGWTTDGKMFDSSVVRGKPATFPLNRVIPGWTEGVQLMTVGEKTRFWIPVELAYNNRPGAPKGMLVFDVELMNIKK